MSSCCQNLDIGQYFILVFKCTLLFNLKKIMFESEKWSCYINCIHIFIEPFHVFCDFCHTWHHPLYHILRVPSCFSMSYQGSQTHFLVHNQNGKFWNVKGLTIIFSSKNIFSLQLNLQFRTLCAYNKRNKNIWKLLNSKHYCTINSPDIYCTLLSRNSKPF